MRYLILLFALGAAACSRANVRTFTRAGAEPCPPGWEFVYTDWPAAVDGSRVVCRRVTP